MANDRRCRCRTVRTTPAQPAAAAVPTTPEPPVRRWPHPVEGVEAARETDSALYYIRCALSYQNQLLAEIKTLLQELVERERNGMER